MGPTVKHGIPEFHCGISDVLFASQEIIMHPTCWSVYD